jgi:hypothetical protein
MFSWRGEMSSNKTAHFDYGILEGDNILGLKSNKRYDVIRDGDGFFEIIDESSTKLFCLKHTKSCAHLDFKTTWILENVVDS